MSHAFNYPEAFARSLMFDRENAGLTQAQLARTLGLTEEAYCDIESGVNMTPDEEIIRNMARIFGLDEDIMIIGFEEALRMKLEMQGVSN